MSNTMAAELLHGNSAGLCYTTLSIIMKYTDSAHLTPSPIRWYVYWLCLWGTSIDVLRLSSVHSDIPRGHCVNMKAVVTVCCQDDPLRAYRKSRDSSSSFSEMGTSFSSGISGKRCQFYLQCNTL